MFAIAAGLNFWHELLLMFDASVPYWNLLRGHSFCKEDEELSKEWGGINRPRNYRDYNIFTNKKSFIRKPFRRKCLTVKLIIS